MSRAPEVCECRFCGNEYGADGITNHETFCDESPNPGVPVEKQKELGLLDAEDGQKPPEASPAADPNPDQRVDDSDEVSLPPRRTPSGDKKDRESDTGEASPCGNCGSEDTIPTHKARQGFEQELDTLPDALRATLDATEEYCNNCWHVDGGELSKPHAIMENPEGTA